MSLVSSHQTSGWNQNNDSTTMCKAAFKLSRLPHMAAFVRQNGSQLFWRQPAFDSIRNQKYRTHNARDSRLLHYGGRSYRDWKVDCDWR